MILRNLLIVFCLFFALQVAAQDKSPNSLAEENAEKLFLAYQTAKFGRANKSADAMILAASILKTTPSDKIILEKTEEGGQPDQIQKEFNLKQTADSYLADAKVYAKKNRNLLGRIAEVKKFTPDTRGATGGPKRAITEVRAFATDVISLQFRGNENAVVSISGDGDTDLDLYIYDENGSLVASDTSGKDDCRVRFFPKRNAKFTIKVKNLGNVSNRYTIVTN